MIKEIRQEINGGILTIPSFKELQEMMWDGTCEAACPDGCIVEPDGYCPHGRPSWLLYLGFI